MLIRRLQVWYIDWEQHIDCIMIIASPASGCDGMILILKVSYGVRQIYKIIPVLTSIRIMANWFVHVTSHRNINVHFRSNGAGTHSVSFVYKAANCNCLPPNEKWLISSEYIQACGIRLLVRVITIRYILNWALFWDQFPDLIANHSYDRKVGVHICTKSPFLWY